MIPCGTVVMFQFHHWLICFLTAGRTSSYAGARGAPRQPGLPHQTHSLVLSGK